MEELTEGRSARPSTVLSPLTRNKYNSRSSRGFTAIQFTIRESNATSNMTSTYGEPEIRLPTTLKVCS